MTRNTSRAIAVIAALGIIGVLALYALRSEPPAATSGAGQTYTSPLGYTIQLPAGWRRSDLLSQTGPVPNGDPEIVATDVFTIRDPAKERELRDRTDTGSGPLEYTSVVSIYRNSRALTPRAYAEREQGAYGLTVVSIEDMTFQGRPAARTTWRWAPGEQRSYATYVRDALGRMWIVGFYLAHPVRELPPGATHEVLRGITDSSRFIGS